MKLGKPIYKPVRVLVRNSIYDLVYDSVLDSANSSVWHSVNPSLTILVYGSVVRFLKNSIRYGNR